MPKDPAPETLLPLKPLVFMTLLSLNDEARHGYAIKKDLEARSEGRLTLEAGTLYRLMARLLKEGLVVESDARPAPEDDDERRRYYQLTAFGTDVLAAEARRLSRLVASPEVKALAAPGRTR